MTYPQAPWTLQGYAIQTLQLVNIERSRPFVPSELEIVSVWPGKTIGGIYVSSYNSASVMEYNELIVVGGLVNYSGTFGAWISHIYVDNPNSVAGGREIWGLPKELAEFTWEEVGDRSRVIVRQGDKQLCNLSYTQQSFAWPQQLAFPSFSTLGSNLLLFKGEFQSRLGLVSGKLEVPLESPFASLGLGQPLLTVYCDELRLVAGTPEIVGKKATTEFSY